ncbi:MAG TPA: hypothetical protein V6D08_04145 [Candidatus Obscuribacterales bacterium]
MVFSHRSRSFPCAALALVPPLLAAVCLSAAAAPPSAQTIDGGAGQEIKDESGAIFMEEIKPPQEASARSSGAPGQVPLDLSGLGVKIDASGKIVPLIQREGGPVMPQLSEMSVYNEPWWWFAPPMYYVGPFAELVDPLGRPFGAYGPLWWWPPGAYYPMPGPGVPYGQPWAVPWF